MIDDFNAPPPKRRLNIDTPGPGIQPVNTGRPAPRFRTPEETAALGIASLHELPPPQEPGQQGTPYTLPSQPGPAPTEPDPAIPADRPPGLGRKPKKSKPPMSRKKKIILWTVAVVVLLAAGGAAAYYKLVLDKPAPSKQAATQPKAAPPPPPPPVSPLTGNPVEAQQTSWPVIGVMIENSGDARPQSGLKDAGIVYEAIAEYGITRFLALYQESRPGNIGPVRSARPYYLDWAMAYDASYAHVGGSPDALARIKQIGTKDLDQFFNPSAYRRITSRYAPHNVYTTGNQLAELAATKGWTTSQFTPVERKADKPYKVPDARTGASIIDFNISGAFYNAHYEYEAASNTYRRFMGGSPHMDADTNTQIQPKTVVALVMPYSLMADGYHSQYATIGSGKMFVFQDGAVTTGTWAKGQPREPFLFKDDSGAILKLNAGQTWFSVVADAGKVIYK